MFIAVVGAGLYTTTITCRPLGQTIEAARRSPLARIYFGGSFSEAAEREGGSKAHAESATKRKTCARCVAPLTTLRSFLRNPHQRPQNIGRAFAHSELTTQSDRSAAHLTLQRTFEALQYFSRYHRTPSPNYTGQLGRALSDALSCREFRDRQKCDRSRM
jgi:hypothetical protein